MVLIEKITAAIPSYIVCYLVNNDLDCVDSIELCEISDYIQNLSREFDEPVFIDFSLRCEDSYFGRNDLNHLLGDVVDMDVLIFKK